MPSGNRASSCFSEKLDDSFVYGVGKGRGPLAVPVYVIDRQIGIIVLQLFDVRHPIPKEEYRVACAAVEVEPHGLLKIVIMSVGI